MYFAYPIDSFCLTNFEKKIGIYQVRFLFSVIPGVDSYHNGEQNLSWMSTTDMYLN